MSLSSVKELLSGHFAPGSTVTVGGGVRTPPDTKAGFYFIALSDGSSFTILATGSKSRSLILQCFLSSFDL